MFSLDSSTESFSSPASLYRSEPGAADPRIYNLSYSSLLTLHACPRKFELDKLGATHDRTEDISDTVTFSYGHTVGLGIQLVLEGVPWESIVLRCALAWTAPIWADNPKQNKSFATALFAVEKFRTMYSHGYLDGFSLVTYNNLPACELSFLIDLPDGYKYRGFVDAVLQHDETGEVIVLECKTSSATSVNPAKYRNSAQAIGYSIVLDHIFPELSSYRVLYLEFSSKTLEFEQFSFEKSYVQRARWIRELVLDTGAISSYLAENLFPMRGESCFDFYRECKYLGLCQMDTEKLTMPLTQVGYEKINKANSDYQIQITLNDLIHTQLKKAQVES